MSQNRQNLYLHNDQSDCTKLSDFLANYTQSSGISTNAHHDLRLVLEETFINIISYAFTDNNAHQVTVEFSCSVNTISISFIDDGIEFNPLTHHTDTDQTIESNDHCEGGMGIHLIKSLTDQQEYNRIKKRNVFTVTKHYTKDHT